MMVAAEVVAVAVWMEIEVVATVVVVDLMKAEADVVVDSEEVVVAAVVGTLEVVGVVDLEAVDEETDLPAEGNLIKLQSCFLYYILFFLCSDRGGDRSRPY